MDLISKKYAMISKIINMTEVEIDNLTQHIKEATQTKFKLKEVEQTQELPEDLAKIFSPVKKEFNLDEIIKEQNYQGYNKEEMDRLVEEMNITEPLEELLKML